MDAVAERAGPAIWDSLISVVPAMRSTVPFGPNGGVPMPLGVTRRPNRPSAAKRARAKMWVATRCSSTRAVV